jgi:BD-FAE protein
MKKYTLNSVKRELAKIKLALLICFVAFSGVFAAGKKEIIKIADIPYGSAGIIDMTLDLYLPSAVDKKMPLAVWIHGGGWRKGSKDRCPMKWLTGEGYAVASISYRLTHAAIFPAQIHDCKGAIRWLRANADILGINPDRIRQFIPRQHYRKGKRIIKDKDAESGYAAPVHNPDQPFSFGFMQNDNGPRKRANLPVLASGSKSSWAMTGNGIFTLRRDIANKDITPGKYKIYRLGEITVTSDCQIWFSSKSWQTRIKLGSRLFDPSENNQWEAYASLKFDGPAYGGEKSRKNTAFCDKIILVKQEFVGKKN